MSQPNVQRDLMRGSLDLLVLSVLAEDPKYGYLIQKRVAEASGNVVKLQAGTLYPLLHRLEAEGAVVSRFENTTGRERKWYRLTAAGRRRLESQANAWHEYVATMRHLLTAALGPQPPADNPHPAS